MMWYSKMKILAGTLLAVLLAGTGVGLGLRRGLAGPPKAATRQPRSAAAAALRSAARSEVRPWSGVQTDVQLDPPLGPFRSCESDRDVACRPFQICAANDVARVIKDLYGPSKVTAWSVATDNRANMLVFNGPDVRYAEIKKLVDKLDETAKHLPSPRSQVIRLKHASAASMAKILRDIYRDETKSAAFSPDTRTQPVRAPLPARHRGGD